MKIFIEILFTFRYFVSPGKTDGYSIVRGVCRPIPNRCQAMVIYKSKEPSGEGVPKAGRLEDCPDADQDLDLTRGVNELYLQSLGSPGGSTDGLLRTVSTKRKAAEPERQLRKKSRYGVDDEIIEDILTLLKDVVVTPPSKIMTTQEWEDNVILQNLCEIDKDVKKAFQRWNFRLRRMTTKQYEEFYLSLKPSTKMLFQNIDDDKEFYYSRQESADYAIKFINFQFPQTAKQFVQDLYNVCDKRVPKKNTLDVLSPHSCGKTWFFDMVCDFYLNVGHLKNFNRMSQFPMQDCRDRRLILWNEPNSDPTSLDTLKTLFGGDRAPAGVKQKDDECIIRTPLIVTGNSRVFPSNDAMNARRFMYDFNVPPELATWGEKKLFPLAWLDVLKHFEIQYI